MKTETEINAGIERLQKSNAELAAKQKKRIFKSRKIAAQIDFNQSAINALLWVLGKDN